MDTLLHQALSLPKRPCCVDRPPLETFSHRPSPTVEHQMDLLLETILGFPNYSSVLSLSLSRILESKPHESDQNHLIESAILLGSALLDSAKKLQRKQFSLHNSKAWVLPPDVTIKVFSMLDTQSLCHVAATCSMFNNCSMDSLCYTNIDLVSEFPKVTNTIVSKMVQRAGKNLQSLKLGILCSSMTMSPLPMGYTIRNSLDASEFPWNDKKSRQWKESLCLTRSCLSSLSTDGAAAGAVLKRLHLYNIEKMDSTALCAALSASPSLLDLEIVGGLCKLNWIDIRLLKEILKTMESQVELRQILESLSANCHGMERLFFESFKTGRDDTLKTPTCIGFVNGCPHLTSLALRGFKLQDYKVCLLVKGFRKLKEVDFSTSYSLTGTFLKNLGGNMGGNLLEILILRDCMHLKEVEVARFFATLLIGDYKFLRYLDISNRDGLASDADWYVRSYVPRTLPIEQILQVRPKICLLAEFPPEESEIDEIMRNSDDCSDISMSPFMLSSQSSAGASMFSSPESSDASDQSSGNEDSGEVMYLESSDEVDFMPD
ncbi:hypothetical protein GIB67_029009 [Kingdonia uniflora]|uniref:F-box domain-containing protein n=1 Tax=Kingdonia uniflora TaxID=39325 RepID=A0A7J7N6T1_9MAGN|nr:hypothetical protein GIB67_029009 [Kingdonia uniflora]